MHLNLVVAICPWKRGILKKTVLLKVLNLEVVVKLVGVGQVLKLTGNLGLHPRIKFIIVLITRMPRTDSVQHGHALL